MPEEVREQAEKELGRLERMGEQTAESSMIRTYLDWLIAVPVGQALRGAPRSRRGARGAGRRPRRAGGRQGPDHRVPRRPQAPRRSAASRSTAAARARSSRWSDLPAWARRRSASRSRAPGREFVRMSLGGVRDEADIRGHRRTYVGALPGRIVRALREAGTKNPVIMLDEIDKIGADWRGDPSSALLEVLDPAQNHTFRDHYLEVDLDLSEVPVHRHRQRRGDDPRPAARPHGGDPARRLHRAEEKLAIATRLPGAAPARPQAACARTRSRSPTRRSAKIVADYTREAGVRNLERELGTHAAQGGHQDRLGRARQAAGRRSMWPRPCASCSAGRSSSPRVGDAHRGARRGHRPGRDRGRRRRPLRRGHRDADGPAAAHRSPGSWAT